MVLKRVLVTGASGMVGRQVLGHLVENGVGCVATSRTEPARLPPATPWVPFDLAQRADASELDALFGDVDAVVHGGAVVPRNESRPDPRTMIDVNVGATQMLAAWARTREAPFVFISGAAVYADPEARAIAETAPTGVNAVGGLYGATKLMAEMTLIDLARDGLAVTVLRPTSVYGPGLPAGKMIRNFLETACRGETIALTPPTGDRVNLVFAGDVATAVHAALSRAATGVFNIPGDAAHSVREIAEACVRAARRGDVQLAAGAYDAAPVVRFDADGTLAGATLGYRPAVSLEDGLRAMLADDDARQPVRQKELLS